MLTIIPTPIGNLADISERVKTTLQSVDALLVEDTRVTGKLLNHFGITKKRIAFHSHNEHQKLEQVIAELKSGKHYGLASDAGPPAISDPGFLIVRACIENEIKVECLPGPTAFVPALAVSGLPTDNFYFEGFLPRKKGRKTKFEFLATLPTTIILYESPYRVVKTLNDIETYMGNRQVSVSREISKKFEETVRGSASEVAQHFETGTVKGEFVICIAKSETLSS